MALSGIRGIAQDAQGVPMPEACVRVFTETGHKLIALNGVSDGNHGLPAKDSYGGFCPANAKLWISRHASTKKAPEGPLCPAGIDTCSYIE
jgi:hypothetical protein